MKDKQWEVRGKRCVYLVKGGRSEQASSHRQCCSLQAWVRTLLWAWGSSPRRSLSVPSLVPCLSLKVGRQQSDHNVIKENTWWKCVRLHFLFKDLFIWNEELQRTERSSVYWVIPQCLQGQELSVSRPGGAARTLPGAGWGAGVVLCHSAGPLCFTVLTKLLLECG